MTYVKTHWINNEEPSIDADNLNHMEQGIEDAQYPDGGSAGQLLAKTANGTEWVDAPNSAVWGLIQGQLNEQEDLYAELESKIVAPTGGTTGQYLRKTAGGTEWADAGSIDTVNNISPDANKNVQTVIELTQAQYNALANPDPNVTYLITDGVNNPANNTINSSGVSYDNTDSGLTATTVQGAIDENATAIEELNNGLTEAGTHTLLRSLTTPSSSVQLSDLVTKFKAVIVEIVVAVGNSLRKGSMYIPVEELTESDGMTSDNQYIVSINENDRGTWYHAFIQFYFSSASTINAGGSGLTGWTGTPSIKVYGVK